MKYSLKYTVDRTLEFQDSHLSLILTYERYCDTIQLLQSMNLKHSLILRVYPAAPLPGPFAGAIFPVIDGIDGNEKDLFVLNLRGRDELLKSLGLHHQWERLRPWRKITNTLDLGPSQERWVHMVRTLSANGSFTL
jgi:hypothetical protein